MGIPCRRCEHGPLPTPQSNPKVVTGLFLIPFLSLSRSLGSEVDWIRTFEPACQIRKRRTIGYGTRPYVIRKEPRKVAWNSVKDKRVAQVHALTMTAS